MTVTTSKYAMGIDVSMGQAEAIDAVTDALKAEGFGILSTIDVQATLKEKIDVDREPYVILGACSPGLANQALNAEPEIGVLLPCNVVVYQAEGQTKISIMDPVAALGLTGNDAIAPLADDVRSRLTRVLENLSNA